MIRLAFGLSCALFAADLIAADAVKVPMRPGLWELTTHMQSDDPKIAKAMEEAHRAMANMPESQRKMMEEVMRKQGVQVSVGAPGETKVSMCMTEEMVNRGGMPQQQKGKCSQKTSLDGNTFNFEFTCTDPDSSGIGTYEFTGDDSYAMDMKISSGTGSAMQHMTLQGTGKHLSDDCGDVKPMNAPK